MGAARQASPDDKVVIGKACLHEALVALAALEAQGAGRVVGAVEVGGVGDDGGDEVRELAGRAALRGDRALGVEVVGEVDDV